jgi:hypothetical protein
MNPVVIKYPLDLTGTAPANKVAGELHSLEGIGNRAFVPNYGPFYTRSLVVRRASTNQILSRDTHYVAAQLFVEATLRSGQEVCSVIVIKDDSIGSDFVIDYQVVGGDYSTSVDAIVQMINALDLDHRSVEWAKIIGKPEKFQPAPHLHDVGDTYGWEYVVAELEAIRQAILVGDEASHREIYQYVDHQDGLITTDLSALRAEYDAHAADQTNPHNVTATQVGLGNVPNLPMATTQQAQDGASNQFFMSPVRVKEAIATFAGNDLRDHIANKNNPHSVTKDQVLLGLVQNYGMATNQEAVTGTATDRYMAPSTTRAAIIALAVDPLNQHIARQDNPHNVTKVQVGLGSVTNAKQVVNTGVNEIKLVWANSEIQATIDATPMGRVHTTSQPDPNIAAHVNRTNNPHSVTAAQVGLGNVPNVGYASDAEATGASGNNLMSAYLVGRAILTRATQPLQAQIDQRVVINSNAQVASLRINSSGNFYQDTDGSITLQVAGARFFQFQASGNYVVHNGRSYAGAGFQPSDRRFKKQIRKTQARRLWRGVDYTTWINRETGETDRGSVAQNVQQHAPEHVSEYDHGVRRKVKRLAVNYTGMAYEMAMAAGQEVDTLRAELELLKTTVQLLRARAA